MAQSGRKIDTKKLFNNEVNSKLKQDRPWKKDAKYFQKTYITSLALLKMSLHAESGGSIEIMGMMTGKIVERGIVVMDVYPLPVEGTETRVNAQAEGYEYMVQYLEQSKKAGREEHIVGWYHSHPGYGCWLSGIDVATQSLNQNFQDPYLAVVVDPSKTIAQGKVEIGAFRTYPDNYKQPTTKNGTMKQKHSSGEKKLPKEKRQDFGAHCDNYYSLDIEIIKSENDSAVIDLLTDQSWISGLINTSARSTQKEEEFSDLVQGLIDKCKEQEHGKLSLMEVSFHRKFDQIFEEEISERLLVTQAETRNSAFVSNVSPSDGEDHDMEDESDLEAGAGKALDVSDVAEEEDDDDDDMSMESTTISRNKRNDAEEDLENEEMMSAYGMARRQRKIQRRRPGSNSSSENLSRSRLGIVVDGPHYLGRQKESLSAYGEHDLKMAKNNKNMNQISRTGELIATLAIEDLLTLRAQQKVFGGLN
ncbi:COP9 signalosome complex subunit 5 [[Candida] anglica]|uniref:COP9 signalosome complex subunit 5 n=1 Tax=[Candida] anglica TaxID=148631 RepID=A0ABP0E5F0_9ASCO